MFDHLNVVATIVFVFFFGLVSVLGFVASLILYVGYLAHVFKFGSDLSESFWGAGLATFSLCLFVLVIPHLGHRVTVH